MGSESFVEDRNPRLEAQDKPSRSVRRSLSRSPERASATKAVGALLGAVLIATEHRPCRHGSRVLPSTVGPPSTLTVTSSRPGRRPARGTPISFVVTRREMVIVPWLPLSQ